VLGATKFLTTELHSLYVKEPESEILERSESGVGVGLGVGHFTSDSAILLQRISQVAYEASFCQIQDLNIF